jgi:hypothetical protein
MRCRHITAFLLFLTALAGSARADDVNQAKTYFNAGAQAYAAGKFTAAIQAFEEAYRLAPRPAILFSIAQAHRRQYYLEKKPDDLGLAIKYYRDYVAKVEQGGRRSDAAEALAELEPLAARVGGEAAKGAPPQEAKQPTRVMVSSQTKGALVSLDGGRPGEAPLISELSPGKHRVKVTAEGFFDDDREIVAVEGGLVALDLPLREKPARLTVTGSQGAEIAIDGRPSGTIPVPTPIEVTPGRHLVVVTKSGRKSFSQELELERGETKTISADLGTTGQRYVAWGLLGLGAGGLIAGGVLAGLAVHQQNVAQGIFEAHEQGNITPEDRERYVAASDRRDDFRRIAGFAFGAGAAFAVTGLILYAFDQPGVSPAPSKVEPSTKSPSRPVEAPMEMSAVPIWSPGFAGASLAARF